MNYWIRHSEGFCGPFTSRRKALKFARRARHIRRKIITEGERIKCTYPEYALSLFRFKIRKGKDIINATPAQIRGWKECLHIDQQMLQNAY